MTPLRVGCAWLLLLLVTGPVPAQAQAVGPTAGPTEISYAELAGYAGVTVCYRGQSYSFLSATLTELELAETRAHEATHVAQMGRFPSCEAFQAWYQTPAGRLDAEAEAYGAGWCAAVRMGADSVSRRSMVIEALERNLGGEVNRLEVAQAVSRWEVCP